MGRKTIAQALKEVMIEQGATKVWAGNPNLCHEAYERAGRGANNRIHPLNRIKSVIDAARRSPEFKPWRLRWRRLYGRSAVHHPPMVSSGIKPSPTTTNCERRGKG